MIRSLTAPSVSSAIKESDEFKNRVRKNNEAKDFLHNQIRGAEVLAGTFNRCNELLTVPKEEIQHSKMTLSNEQHCHHKRHQGTATKRIQSKDRTKRPSAVVRISGVERVPLLLGQVQIGTTRSSQRELLIEELLMRGLTVNPKELMTRLKKMLVENECPEKTDPNDKKCFYPRFLTATD